jgi:hypothetical protein
MLLAFTAGAGGVLLANAGSADPVRIPFAPDSQAAGQLFPVSANLPLNAAVPNASRSMLAVCGSASPYMRVIDVASENVLGNPAVLPAGAAGIAAFNPAGSRLAVPHSGSPYVTIYNTTTWAKITNPAALPAGNGVVCKYNPAGTVLAVGSFGNPALTLYNTGDYSKISDPAVVHTSQVTDLAFSPNGAFLAVSGYTSPYLHVYNTAGWSLVTLTDSPASTWPERLAFSPDGTYLAIGGWYAPYYMIYSVTGWVAITGLPVASSRVFGVGWVSNTCVAITFGRTVIVVDVVAKTVVSRKILMPGQAQHLTAVAGAAVELSGTVRDVNENGLARNVRAVHADTGIVHAQTTSEPVTGVFEMTVYNTDEYNVVCDGGPGELSESIDAVGV